MATTPLTESLVHADLIERLPIPDEATTSRVLVNNSLLRIVVFAMDAEQELTDHTSVRAVVVQVLDGTLRFTVGTMAHTLHGGDVIYLAPNEHHAVVAETPVRFVLTMIQVPD